MNDKDEINNDVLDEGDLASAYQMRENAMALQKATAANAPETHPEFDGESCVSCGDDIPAARLALGKVRCVVCQHKLERKGKLYAARDDS